jgi:predicted RNA-binding protein with PIN domain
MPPQTAPVARLFQVADQGTMARMPARLIVDGNNVIGSRPDGWWRDRAGATRRLVGRLAAWSEAQHEDVLVVFDGVAPAELPAPPRVEVRFAERGGPNAADDVIVALVAAAAEPAGMRVVTSDAGLAARVRAHGAQVTGARAFREQLERS